MKAYQSLLSLAIASAIVAAPVLASAQTYTAYDLGQGQAYGIDGNTVVGREYSTGTAVEWTGNGYSTAYQLGSGQSVAYGISGGNVAGATLASVQATVWNAAQPGNSGTSLGGGNGGQAWAISSNTIVGIVANGITSNHAAVWSLSSPSIFIDLNPSNLFASYAQATDGSTIVGEGYSSSSDRIQAYAWTSESASSAVNLNPNGWYESYGLGVSGNNIVGWGSEQSGPNFNAQAILWSGANPNAYSLLNSAGYRSTQALAISGNYIVGEGISGSTSTTHALVWTGPNFSTVIDLNQYLGTGFDVQATAVDAAGNICGYGYDATGNLHAFAWQIQSAPEPSMLVVPALGLLGILKRRRS